MTIFFLVRFVSVLFCIFFLVTVILSQFLLPISWMLTFLFCASFVHSNALFYEVVVLLMIFKSHTNGPLLSFVINVCWFYINNSRPYGIKRANDGWMERERENKKRKELKIARTHTHFIKMYVSMDGTTIARNSVECFNQYNSLIYWTKINSNASPAVASTHLCLFSVPIFQHTNEHI